MVRLLRFGITRLSLALESSCGVGVGSLPRKIAAPHEIAESTCRAVVAKEIGENLFPGFIELLNELVACDDVL